MEVHIDEDVLGELDVEDVPRMTLHEFRARIRNFNAYVSRREVVEDYAEMLHEIAEGETDFSREAATLYKASQVYQKTSAKLRFYLAADLGDKEVMKRMHKHNLIRF